MAKNYRIAVIAGDGIGREVMPEGVAAMEAAARAYGFGFQWHEFDWSCERYVNMGMMMPEDGLERLRLYDAVYLGDNIDDALAAKRARVPFLGVLPVGSEAHRIRAAKLRELGALAVLHSVKDLEKFWR